MVGALLVAAPANADRTKLLEVDYRTGARHKIDGSGPATSADRELDSMLDQATGGASFSTKELERIEGALRRFLEAARPRAMPRLVLFLYPGRITRNLLKELREVNVDVDLVVDPCSRTICTDSVAQSIELLGRSLRQAVIRTARYAIRFGSITIRTTTALQGEAYDTFRFAADEVVQAGQRSGGGAHLVGRVQSAKDNYPRQMVKDVAQRMKARRVRLSSPPSVEAQPRSVSVALEITSDRVRYRGDVLGAMVGAAEALRASPLTPAGASIQVVASIPFRSVERHTYRCPAEPLGGYLDGRLSQDEIWSTYIVEQKKGGARLTFDDQEAAGGSVGDDDGGEGGEDQTGDILSAHMGQLAPCLSAEAARSRSFKGATLVFSVPSSGRVSDLEIKEREASAALRTCLRSALGRIPFPRRGGAPRQVTYPMFIKR